MHDWSQQVAFCPPGPEEASLLALNVHTLNVRRLRRKLALRRKQLVRKVDSAVSQVPVRPREERPVFTWSWRALLLAGSGGFGG